MRARADIIRALGAVLILVVGAVHVEQYLDFIKDIPTIGVLFLLNGLGAGAICVVMATRLRLLGALSGIILSLGALVSIMIARYASSGLFNYREPTYRTPVVIAIAAEIAAIAVLAVYARAERSATTRPVTAPAR